RRAGTSSIFYAFDPQGNPAEEVNSSDSVLASFDFDAFGSRSISGTATDPYSGLGSQYGYYSDTETGLQLLGDRYYDPAEARFVNRDPIGMAGGVNVYGYVGNDAGNAFDGTGLQSKDSRGKGSGRKEGRQPGRGNDP
ncbi:MAG: RHS repeat-associated core domain-containing protein, partial [Armatimonadetes bacterium]|nr:RHS repeat-associated core domain-containing protein [Armatimonadota bacterium]